MSQNPQHEDGALAYATTSTGPRRRGLARVGVVVGAAVVLYLAIPFVMGVMGVGDRRGPVFYPRELHTALYTTGWEWGGRDGKPRDAFPPTPRGWFWGK